MPSSDLRLFTKAVEAFQAGRHGDAERHFKKFLRGEPMHYGALSLYSVILMQFGRFAEAEPYLRKAATVNTTSDVKFYNHGLTLKHLKRPVEAFDAFSKAIALNSGNPESWNNRGVVLNELDRFDEAILDFDQAIKLAPHYAGAFYNKGKSFHLSGRYEEAFACFDLALKSDPHFAEVWVGRGNLYRKLERTTEALTAFEKAISLKPNLAEAWRGAAWSLKAESRHEQALTAFRTALQINPDIEHVKGEILATKMIICDWENLEKELASCLDGVRANTSVVAPSSILCVAASAADQLRCARNFSQHEASKNVAPIWRGERYSHDRIRIAYLSGDFRDHPVAHLSVGLFEQHNRKRFETFAISFGRDDKSAIRDRLTHAFDRFIDVRTMSDDEIAGMMREMEIDIAVDLMGHTADARLLILARRPAPVQVSYLGYPGTTGTEFIDYLISDPIVIPADHQQHYSEAIAYLPNCYLPNDFGRAISPAPTRADAGLPETGFVFCSFSNAYKITPTIFDIWMSLLKQVGNSILWLSVHNATARGNLIRVAEGHGISADRIVFADRVERQEDHLGRLRLADLFLDTEIYNAHSTACDALWAGVPLITCLGSTFAGRVGASALKSVGLPELVTTSFDDYEAAALRLATNPDLLSSTKAKLAASRLSVPLFDTQQFMRQLETAYEAMWERSQRGEAPRTFSTAALSGVVD